MPNIFKQNLDVAQHPNRNNFDLSFQNHLTMKMGTLYPVFVKPVVSGDSFSIESAFGLKFMPLVFPVQSKMRAHMHFFYVRNKNLWKGWEDWISGLRTAEDGVDFVPPYITNPNCFGTGKIADYMGIPSTLTRDTLTLINFPYRSIVTDGYRVPTFGTNAREVVLFNRGVGVGGRVTQDTLYFGQVIINDSNVKFEETVDYTLGDYARYPFMAVQGLMLLNADGLAQVGYYEKGNDSDTFVRRQGDLTQINALVAEGKLAALIEFKATTAGVIYGYYDAVTNPSFQLLTTTTHNVAASDTPFLRDDLISALCFRGYESIYNVYYRNSHGVDPFMIDGREEYNKFIPTDDGGPDSYPYALHQRNYELDYLTSCLPSPQAGAAPVVGMSALGAVSIEDENGITTGQATLDSDGNITKIAITSPLASVDHARTLMNMASVGMNINDFRNTNALQNFLEQTIRSGYRYVDFIKGHFGTSPAYKELDMPEFIGGFSRDVTVSQISQTTDTVGFGENGSPLGSFAGQANAFGGSEHAIHHYCDDFGFIIGILSVVPTPAYSQMLPKHFTYREQLDYYFPEFAQLGMQPITYKEVAPIQKHNESDNNLQETFGYQRPNYDLVASVDEVHGQFRTTLKDFLINRRFRVAPQLSPDFIKINPQETNDIFADVNPDDDTIIGQIVFKVHAKRPIPRVVIPSLGR